MCEEHESNVTALGRLTFLLVLQTFVVDYGPAKLVWLVGSWYVKNGVGSGWLNRKVHHHGLPLLLWLFLFHFLTCDPCAENSLSKTGKIITKLCLFFLIHWCFVNNVSTNLLMLESRGRLLCSKSVRQFDCKRTGTSCQKKHFFLQIYSRDSAMFGL